MFHQLRLLGTHPGPLALIMNKNKKSKGLKPPPRRHTKETNGSLREAQKQHTEERLIDAARDVFHSKGFSDATVDDIVQAIGASRGAFYLHFSGKKHILGRIFIRDHVEDAIRLFENAPIVPEIDKLKECISGYLKLYGRDKRTIRAWIEAGSLEINVEAAQLQLQTIDRIIAPLAQRVRNFRSERNLRTNDEEARTRALLMFIQVQQFAYFHFIRGLQVNVALGTALMANEWHAAIFGQVD